MASIAQSVLSKPIDYSEGASTAASIILARQKAEEMKIQMDGLKNQYDTAVMTKVIGYMDQAAKAPNPAAKNFLINQAKNFANKNGIEVGEYADYVSKLPDYATRMKNLTDTWNEFLQNPATLPKGIALTKEMIGASDESQANSIAKDMLSVLHYQSTVEAAKARTSIQGSRMGLMQNKAEYNALKDAQNAKPVAGAEAQYKSFQNAMNIINDALSGKGMTYGQLSDIQAEYAAGMMPQLSAVVPIGRQHGIAADVPGFSKFWETNVTQNITNSPSTKVPTGVVKMLKKQIDPMMKLSALYHDYQLGKQISRGVSTGLVKQENADKLFNESRLGGNITYKDAIMGYKKDAQNDFNNLSKEEMGLLKSAKNPHQYSNLPQAYKDKISESTYNKIVGRSPQSLGFENQDESQGSQTFGNMGDMNGEQESQSEDSAEGMEE